MTDISRQGVKNFYSIFLLLSIFDELRKNAFTIFTHGSESILPIKFFLLILFDLEEKLLFNLIQSFRLIVFQKDWIIA